MTPEEPVQETPKTAAAAAPARTTRRKVRTGVVVSDAMDKTVLVRIDRKVQIGRAHV